MGLLKKRLSLEFPLNRISLFCAQRFFFIGRIGLIARYFKKYYRSPNKFKNLLGER